MMFDAYRKQLSTFGRGAAFGLALVCGVAGAWMLLSPGGARLALMGARSWWDAGKSGTIALGTGSHNGGYFRIGSELAEAVRESGPYTVSVRESTGSLDNLKQLLDGTLDFGLVQGGFLGDTSVAEGAATDGRVLPIANRVLPIANVDQQYVHIVVPVDSAAESLRDLSGMRLGVGPEGSGHEALAKLLFGYFGASLSPRFVANHSPNLEQAFDDGQIDAAFSVYGLFAPAMEELLNTGMYRLLPIMEADALARYLPGAYAASLPPDLYGPDRSIPPATFGPFPTLMVNTFLVARRDVPDAQVRAMLDGLYSARFRYNMRLTDLDEVHGRVSPLVPLHPAAEAWYARKEPLSSDRFEVASFFLAGVVTLAGFTQYLMGRRHWLRRVRSRRSIRPYFERMLEYGTAVEVTSDASALGDIIHEMMAAQRDAESKWLAGALTTEHMENLYLLYNTRSRNAFDKILQLHLQALLEGGPSPAMYHPEVARPSVAASPPAAISPAPVAPPAPVAKPVPVAKPTPAPVAVQEPAKPVGAPPPARAQHEQRPRGKKHKGNRAQTPSPASTPVQASPPVPVRPAAAAPAPQQPRSEPATAPPSAPRQLSEWEIEQKYQRSDDYAAGDFESGIVSPPRPRRVQAQQDGAAPARADLADLPDLHDLHDLPEEPEEKRPQLDLF